MFARQEHSEQWVDFFFELIYDRIVKVIESQIKITFFYNLFFSSKIYFLHGGLTMMWQQVLIFGIPKLAGPGY